LPTSYCSVFFQVGEPILVVLAHKQREGVINDGRVP